MNIVPNWFKIIFMNSTLMQMNKDACIKKKGGNVHEAHKTICNCSYILFFGRIA